MIQNNFFRSELVIKELDALEVFCRTISDADSLSFKSANQLLMVLSIISGQRDEFDLRCGCNIQWFGDTVAGRIRNMNQPIEAEHISLYLVLFYRFISEWELSEPGDFGMELDAYLRYVESIYQVLNVKEQAQVDFVKHRMPTLILKKLLNSEGIGYLGVKTGLVIYAFNE